ncbi:hypothetical protein D3C71_1469490 [compost metagenome]
MALRLFLTVGLLAACVGAFFVIGAAMPESERNANDFRAGCAAMLKRGLVATQQECDAKEAEIRRRGQ